MRRRDHSTRGRYDVTIRRRQRGHFLTWLTSRESATRGVRHLVKNDARRCQARRHQDLPFPRVQSPHSALTDSACSATRRFANHACPGSVAAEVLALQAWPNLTERRVARAALPHRSQSTANPGRSLPCRRRARLQNVGFAAMGMVMALSLELQARPCVDDDDDWGVWCGVLRSVKVRSSLL